jgi:hypothetical protein
MRVSVAAALAHINHFMHPQAVFIDKSEEEDEYFVRAMREKARDLNKPLIELPENSVEDLMWMTRLDSGSLAGKSELLQLMAILIT